MTKREPTWLDARHGWDESGNVVDTFWIGDPAIDQKKSDIGSYRETLDPAHLVVKPGEQPVRMVVKLPDPVQWAEISSHFVEGMPPEVSIRRAAAVACQLCVRFPDVPSAAPAYRYGAQRLPDALLAKLQREHPDMIPMIGWWIVSRSMLSDDEKKASSPGSGAKTSESSPTTTATTATPGARCSKGARTSAKKRNPKRKTG